MAEIPLVSVLHHGLGMAAFVVLATADAPPLMRGCWSFLALFAVVMMAREWLIPRMFATVTVR